MAAFATLLLFVAVCTVAGILAARDPRPQRRPPEWSVGALITPRR